MRLVSPSPRITVLCLALAACASREIHVLGDPDLVGDSLEQRRHRHQLAALADHHLVRTCEWMDPERHIAERDEDERVAR